MPAELPTTTIGLIAFLVLCAGIAIKYLADQNKNTVKTFMEYIQTKNGNYERSSLKFAETMEKAAHALRDGALARSRAHGLLERETSGS